MGVLNVLRQERREGVLNILGGLLPPPAGILHAVEMSAGQHGGECLEINGRKAVRKQPLIWFEPGIS